MGRAAKPALGNEVLRVAATMKSSCRGSWQRLLGPHPGTQLRAQPRGWLGNDAQGIFVRKHEWHLPIIFSPGPFPGAFSQGLLRLVVIPRSDSKARAALWGFALITFRVVFHSQAILGTLAFLP